MYNLMMTLIEKVEDFIQTVLKDRPVMLHQLHQEISEYITDNKEIERKLYENALELDDYLRSPNGNEMDAIINQEVMSKANV